jgi:hypothetical protein
MELYRAFKAGGKTMNMSYCRFQNTLQDLKHCADYIEDLNLGKEENEARIRLIELCQDITKQFEGEDVPERFAENEEAE